MNKLINWLPKDLTSLLLITKFRFLYKIFIQISCIWQFSYVDRDRKKKKKKKERSRSPSWQIPNCKYIIGFIMVGYCGWEINYSSKMTFVWVDGSEVAPEWYDAIEFSLEKCNVCSLFPCSKKRVSSQRTQCLFHFFVCLIFSYLLLLLL